MEDAVRKLLNLVLGPEVEGEKAGTRNPPENIGRPREEKFRMELGYDDDGKRVMYPVPYAPVFRWAKDKKGNSRVVKTPRMVQRQRHPLVAKARRNALRREAEGKTYDAHFLHIVE